MDRWCQQRASILALALVKHTVSMVDQKPLLIHKKSYKMFHARISFLVGTWGFVFVLEESARVDARERERES